MEPTRQIYWNIVDGGWIYAFFAVAMGWLAWGVWKRIRLWRTGGSEDRLNRIPDRIFGVLKEIFGQERHLLDPLPGIAHLMIFYGFLAEFIATMLIAVQEWTGVHFLQGNFYLGYSLLSDLFGGVAIVGLLMMLYWRAVLRPSRLHSALDDWVAVPLLLVLFVQGFFVEALRLAATEPPWAAWSPIGYALSFALKGLPESSLLAMHRGLWWVHAVTAFAFLAYFVFGKFGHVVYGGSNILLRSLQSTGKLSHPDIDVLLEEDEEALDHLGVGKIEGFTWKGLMDLDACVNCGRCEAMCPATISGSPLSPRKLIQDMKNQLTLSGPHPASDEAGDAGTPISPLIGDGEDSVPAVLEAELWGCRTCGACMHECPMFIEHIPKIVDMRRHLVMTESKMGEEAQALLKSMDDRMHPFVGSSRDREEWFNDLDVKVYGRGDQADTLFWVGCAGSMVDRNIDVSRALVKVMQSAGVDFALLGNEEVCTGDPARRVGGELTYQMCAKENIETFERYGIKRIVTACPHCMNTLKNEYSDYGGQYEVVHHSQLIDDLISDGSLKPRGDTEAVTYHDPCYLGRHNGVYEEPRKVAASVSAEGELIEMKKNRSRAHCCGSGGGLAWMDDKPARRINHERFEQVQGCGAKTAALSCPFCMQMFEDAGSALDPDGEVRVADIAELIAEAIEE